MKASVFCNVSARSGHFVNVDVIFLPSVCDSFCVSTFSLGQGCRSFCYELYEQSTVVFCKSGRDACFTIVCILCADHVFWYPWFPCREFNSCVFFPFGLTQTYLEVCVVGRIVARSVLSPEFFLLSASDCVASFFLEPLFGRVGNYLFFRVHGSTRVVSSSLSYVAVSRSREKQLGQASA